MKRMLSVGYLVVAGAVCCAMWTTPTRGQEAQPDPKTATFEQLLQRVQTEPGATPQRDVAELLDLGGELGRSYTASLAIKGYLTHNFRPSPELLLKAATTAVKAGDYRAAAARYKSYLAQARPDQASSDVAADLYEVLIDFGNAPGDAYTYMSNQGARHRESDAARRFDRWYLAQAQRSRDYANHARLLSDVMVREMPLEYERLHYWDHLDWLIDELRRGRSEQFGVLPYTQSIVKSVRDSRRRAARLRFFAAHLAFRAGASGKDEEALERDFELVADAAKDYLKAFPTGATLVDIGHAFTGGDHNRMEDWAWDQQAAQKQAFMVDGFASLSDAQRDVFMRRRVHYSGMMHRKVISRAGWAELARRIPEYFRKSPHTRHVAFLTQSDDLEVYKRQAAVLKGVPSREAAIINSVAASDGDYIKAIDHLMTRENWHLAYDAFYPLVRDDIWRAVERVQPEDKELPGDTRGRGMLHFGRRYVANTPIAVFDLEASREYIYWAFRYSGKTEQDKSQVAEHLKALVWVPHPERDRRRNKQDAWGSGYGEFKKWASWVRREKGRNKDITQAMVDQIAPLEEAFRAVMGRKTPDLSKAPNDLCRAVAEMRVAERAKDRKRFFAAAEALYKRVRAYPRMPVPFGEGAFAYLHQTRGAQLENLDFQLKLVADALADYDPGEPTDHIERTVEGLRRDRWRWDWWRWPKDRQDEVAKIREVLGAALQAQVEKGVFWPQLFNWYRGTRKGDHWEDRSTGNDIMAAIIERQLLHKSGWRPDSSRTSATVSYMQLVHREFPGLRETHPVETSFDDMFVKEARETGLLDYGYFSYGSDRDGRIADVAAEVLARYRKLPLGYDDDDKVIYDRDALWDWHERALSAAAAPRDKMLKALGETYGKTRYDAYAMGRPYFRTQADVSTEQGRKAYFEQLTGYLKRYRSAAGRFDTPHFGSLEEIDSDTLTVGEADALLGLFDHAAPAYWSGNRSCGHITYKLSRALVKQQRYRDLYAALPYLWRITRDSGWSDLQRDLARTARSLQEEGEHDLAMAMTVSGMQLLGGHIQDDVKSMLQAVKSNALTNIGGVIPVRQTDPRYPIFAAQAAYLTQRYQTAWDTYRAHQEKLNEMFRELDPNFCLWIIRRNTEIGRYEQANALIQAMTGWIDRSTDGVDPEIRARLVLEYADIAMAQQEYTRARAWYQKVATNEDYTGTRAQRDAQLAVAEVERRLRNYDEATRLLNRLAREQDAYLQVEARYYLAKVKYDQEQYVDARQQLERVFTYAPDHENGRLLEGEINLKLKKIEHVTNLPVGTVTNRRLLVPGKPLQVELEDRNLAVVGRATDVELKAWTDSGDVEYFTLRRFADSKTRFQGLLATALASKQEKDGTLQVLGDDTIYYDFSETFKAQNKITESEPFRLQIATDGGLLASSGRILSEQEREEEAMRRMIEERLGRTAAREGADVPLSMRRQGNQIKPGNRINVRVVDPDRSTTAEIDEIEVKVAASSGDSIKSFVLRETDTHSGVFEGAVPTDSGQAMAYASDSNTAKEPNFAISKGDYPAWEAFPDNKRPKTFSVDFNDSIDLAEMTVTSKEAGRKLKDFHVQVSHNGRSFQTIGHWPGDYAAWDGSPQVQIVRFGESTRVPRSVDEVAAWFEQGYLSDQNVKVTLKPKTFGETWDGDVAGQKDKLNLAWDGARSYYVARWRTAVYQPERRVRTFTLQTKREGDRTVAWFMRIDGVGAASRGRGSQADPNVIQRSLAQGLHVIEVYVVAARRAKHQFRLLWDTDEEPYKDEVPAAAMDVSKVLEAFPLERRKLDHPAATITAAEDDTQFRVRFPEDTRARVLRLLMADFETDAPAINRITLKDRAGKVVLPTKEDFMTLRGNQVLEIIPGDRVTLTYEDPKVVTRGREKHEAFLSATFFNGTIDAAFVEYTQRGGQQVPQHVKMRRFEPGDTIVVFVQDPDADVSEERDRVSFKASTSMTKPVTFEAIETAPHSGTFEGRIFPVSGRPKRREEMTVQPGADVMLSYRDAENTDPGVPTDRGAVVEQVSWRDPQLRVYEVTSRRLTDEEIEATRSTDEDELGETVAVRRTMVASRPDAVDHTKPTAIRMEGPLLVEVLHPAIAKSSWSKATVYAQTSSGRALHKQKSGDESAEPFDIDVPGTIRLSSSPGDVGSVATPAGYQEVLVRGDPTAVNPLDDGRFGFNVPMTLGPVPARSLATDDVVIDPRAERPALAINGDDTIYVGFQYKDDNGKTRWITHKVMLGNDAMFDVMDRKYTTQVSDAHVGETLYFRVIDQGRDVSDDRDNLKVRLQAASGASRDIELVEEFAHNGVFKGLVKVVFTEDKEAAAERDTFAVKYGDRITASYQVEGEEAPLQRVINVYKGSDGAVVPFTKRFKDKDIAVQTQFTVAEAYFELAKRHRELGEEGYARREILQGEKLLKEAIRDYPDSEYRAQADYLLAELAMEGADDTKDEELKQRKYRESLRRFADIVASYPDSQYAARAQYKKGIVYEQMNQLDAACEEYVKLSYRYPDSEFVADTINRLGLYFLKKGRGIGQAANKLEDPIEAEKLRIRERRLYRTAGEVFGRMAERFPQHKLAGPATVKSAQCFIRAAEHERAVKVFLAVIDNKSYEPELIAEAMYWCGYCYMTKQPTPDYIRAYRMFKRLEWDYPASQWAKWGRGRLADPALQKAASKAQ